MRIEVSNLKVSFGQRKPVSIFEGFDLSVPQNQFLSVVGPSGCGKSTLLRAVGGLLQPNGGTIRFFDGDSAIKPRCLMSFQDHRLFPWLSALQNATLALQAQGVSKSIRENKALKMMERFGLGGAADMFPDQLSGGMKQRVSLIRLLISNGDILLFDEPLSALDAQNRVYLQNELRDIWSEDPRTVIYVTHDIEEALYLSQRVIVLGRKAEILEDIPVSDAVRAGVIGSVNSEREALRWKIWQQLPPPENELARITAETTR